MKKIFLLIAILFTISVDAQTKLTLGRIDTIWSSNQVPRGLNNTNTWYTLYNHVDSVTMASHYYVSSSLAALTLVSSGTFVDTVSKVSNLDSVMTNITPMYTKIGKVVTVVYDIYADPNTTLTQTVLELKLPSYASSSNAIIGQGVFNDTTPTSVYVYAVSDHAIQCLFTPVSTSFTRVSITVTYRTN